MKNHQNEKKPFWRITINERKALLFIGDVFSATIALATALYFWARRDLWMDFTWEFLLERPPNWYYLLPVFWLLLLFELYDLKKASRKVDTIRNLAGSTALATFLYLMVFFVSEPKSLPRRGVAAFIASAAGLTLLWRLLYIRIFTAPLFLRRVVIIGAGRAGSTLAGQIKKMDPPPYTLVGFIDDDTSKVGTKIAGLSVLGKSADLMGIIAKENITDIIFSISGDMQPSMYAAILNAEEKGIEVNTMPVVYEALFGRVPVSLLADDWVVKSFVDRAHASDTYELMKRTIDIIGACIGIFLLVLFFPLISLIILLDDGFPIIFRQTRLGKSGQAFRLLKFRSMRRDAEDDGVARFAVENDERVTRVGNFLRRSHLDELPQFINVLRGDISLVGPRAERPVIVKKLGKEIPFYRARLFIKPGVTGWAQINYQYASNTKENTIKLEHDLYYIMHRNLLMDLLIIFRTLGAVFGFRGQ